MQRNIAIVGLFQVVLVIVGFFALGVVMKIAGYQSDGPNPRFDPAALFMRRHGLAFLGFPTLWTVFASTSMHREWVRFSVGFWMYIAAVFSFLITSLYCVLCFTI